MIRRTPIWQADPELAAEAAQLRAATRPNGLDRGDSRRIELVPFGEMAPILTQADLVAGLLGSAQLSAVYGPPGCGKTFLALDIALCVATGKKLRGRRITKGPVVYVAAEAGRRIFNRVAAWRMSRMRDDDDERGAVPVPFYAVPMQIDLCSNDDDLDELIVAIRKTCGSNPILIVIDTVSRVMAGGNENSPEDMGAIIASADRLRDEFGANVCLIHHVGKDASRGARGHSSLFAAIDTAIEVTRDDNAKISTAKDREAARRRERGEDPLRARHLLAGLLVLADRHHVGSGLRAPPRFSRERSRGGRSVKIDFMPTISCLPSGAMPTDEPHPLAESHHQRIDLVGRFTTHLGIKRVDRTTSGLTAAPGGGVPDIDF
jgi:AAA domain